MSPGGSGVATSGPREPSDSASSSMAWREPGSGTGGDPGSATNRDSSTVFTVTETGTYYILEGSWSPDAPGDGWSQSVPEGSTYKLNVSVEFPPEPVQPGVAGQDTLRGGTGSDLLDGGLSADVLIGGTGEDSFRFSTALGQGNLDRITDFNVADDLILLARDVFDGIADLGALAFGAFHRSSTGSAQDAGDRILYETDSGVLSYDADGSGQGGAVAFARLSANLNLSAEDFYVV